MHRSAELSASSVGRKKPNWKFRLIVAFLLIPAASIAFYTWVAALAYSSGERSGYIQKISRKGWICKTWEGELAMTTLPGTAPQIFQFSVRNDERLEKSSRPPVSEWR